jgi:hypothetical protein
LSIGKELSVICGFGNQLIIYFLVVVHNREIFVIIIAMFVYQIGVYFGA